MNEQFQQMPNPTQPTWPPVQPPARGWWQRYRHWILYPVVAIAGVSIGALSAQPSTNGPASSPTVTVTPAQPAAATTTTTEPEPSTPSYATPQAKDFHLTVKVREKQCFGSAGCNVTYRIDASWDKTFDPSVTYDVTYEVRGGEDGPVVATMTVTGDSYERSSEDMVSTRSAKTKMSAVVTRIETQ